MDNTENKLIFSKNLKHYLDLSGKERKDICNVLGIKYSTFCAWISADKYPRIDKIELLANYFGILKSDLIENKNSSNIRHEISKLEKKHFTTFKKLSDSGKEKVIDYTEFIYSSENKGSE